MEVQPAGEYVRARESSETEVRAIGAATNRLHLWLHASHLDGFLGDVHNSHVRLHLLAHIVILVFYFCAGRSVAIFFVDEIHAFLHESLLLLEAFAEVVADYVPERSLFHRAAKAYDVIESLVAFGIFRSLLNRKQGIQLHSY